MFPGFTTDQVTRSTHCTKFLNGATGLNLSKLRIAPSTSRWRNYFLKLFPRKTLNNLNRWIVYRGILELKETHLLDKIFPFRPNPDPAVYEGCLVILKLWTCHQCEREFPLQATSLFPSLPLGYVKNRVVFVDLHD